MPTQSPTPPLRLGILSTAKIARLFAAGVRSSATLTVAAVASRDPAKAEQFAREMMIPRHYGSYEDLLADPEIDAIYNPLPNSLHAEWSIRAAAAHKHVLCEKPLAVSAAQARAMFAEAERNGIYLVEGYPYRAQPQTLKLQELLDSGALGPVQMLQAGFGFTMNNETNIRMAPALGGGALLDVGVYPVSLARMVAKQRPSRVTAWAQWTNTGVDRTLVGTIEFPGGLLAQIAGSFATHVYRQALIAGPGGVIQTTFINHPTAANPPVLHFRHGSADAPVEVIELPATNGFLAEAESFARLVRGGWSQWTGATPAESIDIMLTLEALLESAHSGKPVTIAAP